MLENIQKTSRELAAYSAPLIVALGLSGCSTTNDLNHSAKLPALPKGETSRFHIDPASYPAYPRSDAVLQIAGENIPDPYASMRNHTNAQFQHFIAENNSLAAQVFTNNPIYAAAYTIVSNTINIGSRYAPYQSGDTLAWIARRPGEQESTFWSKNKSASDAFAYYDPNKDHSGKYQVVHDDEAPNGVLSPDGKRSLVCIVPTGTENKIWQVVSTETGKIDPLKVENCMLSLAVWDPSGQSFYTSQYPGPDIKTNQAVVVCKLSTSESAARIEKIYNRPDLPDANFDPSVTSDGKYAVITIWPGANPANGVALVDLKKAEYPAVEIWPHSKAECRFIGNTGQLLYFLSENKILAIDPQKSQAGFSELKLPELKENEKINSIRHLGNCLLVDKLVDGRSTLEVYNLQGEFIAPIPLPGVGQASDIKYSGNPGEFYYEFSSPTVSQIIFNVKIKDDRVQQTVWHAPENRYDLSQYSTELVFAPNSGSRPLPMFITTASDTVKDGKSPTIISFYGAYGTPVYNGFDATIGAWLKVAEMCGENAAFVTVGLPGGGEYSGNWAESGMGTNKVNTVAALASATRELHRIGLTSPEHTVIASGSMGALVAATAAIQNPQLFAGVNVDSPFVAPVEFQIAEKDDSQVNEVGDAKNPSDLAVMRRELSPNLMLQDRANNVPLPAFSLIAGSEDARVPLHYPAALAAALQAAGADCLLTVNQGQGHGNVAMSRNVVYDNVARRITAAALETGMQIQVK